MADYDVAMKVRWMHVRTDEEKGGRQAKLKTRFCVLHKSKASPFMMDQRVHAAKGLFTYVLRNLSSGLGWLPYSPSAIKRVAIGLV
jgi:hypothetical protein